MLDVPGSDCASRRGAGGAPRPRRRRRGANRLITTELRDRIRGARRWFVLTGAGISAESGIPTFRGAGGLWEGSRAEDLATPEGFRRDPALVWRWYRWRRSIVDEARPNQGHVALARIDSLVDRLLLATQNVDDLHERAGSRRLVHLHGRIHGVRCSNDCGLHTSEDPSLDVPLCACGAPLRPAVVWFGESLPRDAFDKAHEAVSSCEVCLVAGTSALVYPAAGLPQVAQALGAIVIDVNTEETAIGAIAALSLRGTAAEVLPRFLDEIGFSQEPPARGGV